MATSCTQVNNTKVLLSNTNWPSQALGSTVNGVLATGARIFVRSDNMLFAIDSSTNKLDTLVLGLPIPANGTSVLNLQKNSTDLVWLYGTKFYRIALNATAPAKVDTLFNAGTVVRSFAVDNANLYFALDTLHAIVHVTLATGVADTLVKTKGVIDDMQLQGSLLYYSDFGLSQVMKIPTTGGTPVAETATADFLGKIVVTSTNVFWEDWGAIHSQTLGNKTTQKTLPTSVAAYANFDSFSAGTSQIAWAASSGIGWTAFDGSTCFTLSLNPSHNGAWVDIDGATLYAASGTNLVSAVLK